VQHTCSFLFYENSTISLLSTIALYALTSLVNYKISKNYFTGVSLATSLGKDLEELAEIHQCDWRTSIMMQSDCNNAVSGCRQNGPHITHGAEFAQQSHLISSEWDFPEKGRPLLKNRGDNSSCQLTFSVALLYVSSWVRQGQTWIYYSLIPLTDFNRELFDLTLVTIRMSVKHMVQQQYRGHL